MRGIASRLTHRTDVQQVEACLNCFKSLEWHRQKNELKLRNQKAQESAFCQLHRIVIGARLAPP